MAYHCNDRGYAAAVSNAARDYVYRSISAVDAFGEWTQAGIAMGTACSSCAFYPSTGQIENVEIRNTLSLLHGQEYNDYDMFDNLRNDTYKVRSGKLVTLRIGKANRVEIE